MRLIKSASALPAGHSSPDLKAISIPFQPLLICTASQPFSAIALYAAVVAPVAAGRDALLKDLVEDAVMEGRPVRRGE